ncbi:hypothetical protein OG453_33650 [Streptomyces sp. NBC_01381]|uniref:hypothetical protein n=1 Tax=Streptomyces sp. NBC_01381 TaxID=2903845 RepID=UPI002252869A|nr:hypothetical protein [Streptomyces sp. NBC_01381]MCX4671578.1 hypothetical protein [Streptomyces sp. NBC_01381]
MSDSDNGVKKIPAKIWIWGGLGTAALIAAIIWAPWYFEGQHVRDGSLASSAGIIITGLRTAFIAVIAGAIGGLGLWYTHRNHKLAREQFEENQVQFARQYHQAQQEYELAHQQFLLVQNQFKHTEKQFEYEQEKDRASAEQTNRTTTTDDYVTSIKLLGSQNLPERLGAIYGLQRIARDSPEDRDRIRQVLTAFFNHRVSEQADAARSGARYTAEDMDAARRVAHELGEGGTPTGG